MSPGKAIEAAEEMLYSHHARFGESGWRCYTPQERRRLMLLANTIYSEITGYSFYPRLEGTA